ncbi:RNA polymerase sigma factor SigM [Nocardioides aurantiacus]|uniref:RNA polymerase ECF family sigma subunit n=1 Tax=Nocardioides aurantiacus TaxID=86796 RepID=A0A3N2CZG3_9ACTN|nr:RNA polymerase sigma factor SigM [Nocardioides aurantiacus]ROR92910.1 RNA polymerase ECF family sigma subunit [Nocardioides aurantiacus]
MTRDDRTLLRAHVDGDPTAFAELVTRHRDRLWAVALRTTGHREEAADALQDALVAAHRKAATYRGEAAVTTWLHRIVVNACLDRIRRSRVRAADPLPDDLGEHPPPGAARADPAPGPEEAVLARETHDRVLAALATLPPEQRACLVLVDMEARPLAEVAEVLGVPVGTVKSRCARGRARLAALLGEDRPPGTVPPPPASHHRGGDPR